MTARTALLQGTDLLASAAVSEPRLTAEVLLCHALRRERVFLYSHPEHELSELEWIHYGRYLHERMRRKPTQYITRKQEFYAREFTVSPAVLIPRPETEHVVEEALRVAGGARKILDIGTGSGILAVTLALECRATACATDLSEHALRVARENARRHEARVEPICCDLASAVAGPFDLAVSNPPYVEEDEYAALEPEVRDYEPRLALLGGRDVYRRLFGEALRVLRPGGWLVCEIGAGQASFLDLFDEHWDSRRLAPDLAGRPRVLSARRR